MAVRRKGTIWLGLLLPPAIFLCVVFVFSQPTSGGPQTWQTKRQRSKRVAPPAKEAVPKEVAMPFPLGEILNYRVAWATFSSAASVRLAVPERRDLYGWQTWHFRAAISTVRPVRTLFSIDDQFDSYTDSVTLESRQYEMYLNELGKSETAVLHFVPQEAAPRGPGPIVVVLAGTRDPLGALYTLRAADWQHSPEVRAPVCDGRNLYEISAKVENASEKVTVDAGTFSASRIGIHLFDHGKQVSQISFELWLAQDASRTPVLISAELPFGSVRGELTKAAP
jgi:hypothetical protein